jgi:hypothetical protein
MARLSAERIFTRRDAQPSEPEFVYTWLVEAEVVTNLVTYRLDDLPPETLGIVAEVSHECVAKNQDLVRQATAPEVRHTRQLGADVHAVSVVLGTAVGHDDRDVLLRALELVRQLDERRTNEFLERLLAVVPVSAHGFVFAPIVAHPLHPRSQRTPATDVIAFGAGARGSSATIVGSGTSGEECLNEAEPDSLVAAGRDPGS